MASEALYDLAPAYLSTLSQPSLPSAYSVAALMAFLLFFKNTKTLYHMKALHQSLFFLKYSAP